MELDKARIKVVEKELNPISLDTTLRKHEVAQELLDTDYDDYCERLSGIDFDELEARTTALLAETADPYDDLLAHFGGRALPGLDLREMWTHDLSRMFHGEEFAPLFPGEAMVPGVERMVSAMGLDLTAGGRIELDIEKRPSKTPRAFCATVRVPHEVKLVLQPYGGHDDWSTFLHELGHALHFANVDPEQPLEFRRMGDNGVTEGWAMTFDHLILRALLPAPRRGDLRSRAILSIRGVPRAVGSAALFGQALVRALAASRGARSRPAGRIRDTSLGRDAGAHAARALDRGRRSALLLRPLSAGVDVRRHGSRRASRPVRRRLVPEPAQRAVPDGALGPGQEGRVEDLARERLGVDSWASGP